MASQSVVITSGIINRAVQMEKITWFKGRGTLEFTRVPNILSQNSLGKPLENGGKESNFLLKVAGTNKKISCKFSTHWTARKMVTKFLFRFNENGTFIDLQ